MEEVKKKKINHMKGTLWRWRWETDKNKLEREHIKEEARKKREEKEEDKRNGGKEKKIFFCFTHKGNDVISYMIDVKKNYTMFFLFF